MKKVKKLLTLVLMLALMLSLAACTDVSSDSSQETMGKNTESENSSVPEDDGDNFIDFVGGDSDDSVNPPDDGGNTPDDGGNTPDDGGNTPNDGGNTPDDGGNTPDDGGNTPDDGGNTPDDGGNTPDDGGNTPDDGGNTPDDGDNTPDNGGDQTYPVPQTYKLTLESEGDFGIQVIEIKYGDPLNLPTPSRGSEYVFMWWEDKETGQPVSATEYLFASDKTFVAVWSSTWTPDY